MSERIDPTGATYRIETINDVLAVPPAARSALFRDLELALSMHELVHADSAGATSLGAISWTDDGRREVTMTEADGSVVLSLQVTESVDGAAATPSPEAAARGDAGAAGAHLAGITRGKCACRACLRARDERDATGWPVLLGMMVVCLTCGNKRCPHAYDHIYACTRSNEHGQPGAG